MVRSNQQLIERMTLVWHDWFATSNDGVGSQKFMLDQNKFLRSHALGSFESMLIGLTKDPAMLIWLNGIQNTKWSPNENYARELMELFTLGAGRGYTEDDVREQARALTGWRVDWDDGSRLHQLPLRPELARRRRQDDLRQERQVQLAGRVPPVPRELGSRLVLREEAVELLHPDASVGVHSVGAHPPVQALRLQGEAGRRGDTQAPAALHGPADDEAADRPGRRDAPRARSPRRHGGLVVALLARRPASLLPAERRRLERRSLARHLQLPRPLDGCELCPGAVRARHRRLEWGAAVRRRQARGPSACLLGRPDDDHVDPHDVCAPSPRTRSPTRARARSGTPTPS